MFKHLILVYALFSLPAHAGVIVYENDFENGVVGPAISGGGSVVGTQGYSAFGFGSRFLQNTTGSFEANSQIATTITLSELPTHDSINIGFLFAAINSWDGDNLPGGGAPDIFQVIVDGIIVFSESFANFPGLPQTAGISNRIFTPTDLGFFFSTSREDSAYDYTAFTDFSNIAHTSDTLNLSFITAGAGWQGGGDESFGLDNITISLNGVKAVPEPGTLALFGLGLFGLFRRRLFS